MSEYGVYVHMPWCRAVCPYCAFNVRVDAAAPFAAYVDALLTQWDALQVEFSGRPTTLSLGGGTPSLVPAEELARLVRAVSPTVSVEMEANPEDLTPARLDAWVELGVTRLSLGVQTFSPRHARLLKRAHSVSQARDAVAMVLARPFKSASVDLIFGLPEQTPAELAEDLDALLDSGVPHASLYGLTVEPGTPLARAVDRGALTPADEDAWAEMFAMAAERLSAAGLPRYEVSNFARPGHESAHNTHYWRGRPYAGLGVGAHGLMPDGRRTVGAGDPATFIASPTRFASEELPDPRQRAVDLLVSTLRHRDGLTLDSLWTLGFTITDAARARLRERKVIDDTGASLRLMGEGWALEHAVLRALEQGLEPHAGVTSGVSPS